MDRLMLKRNTKILASISKKAKMLIHHVLIHSSFFFKLKFAILVKREPRVNWSSLPVERSLRSKEWSRLLIVVHAKQQIRIVNTNCQCRWRSCNEVTKLKIIKRPAVRYFSIFLLEIQKVLIRKCSTFIYNPQALPGSLKFRTWCFSLTLYTEYEAIQALDT